MTNLNIQEILAVIDADKVSRFGNIILDIILIAIPQALFLVMLTAILLNRFELIKNFKKLSVPVLFFAIISNILRYYGMSESLIFVFSTQVIFILMLIVNRERHFKEILKTFICLIISIVVSLIMERLYIRLLFYAMGSANENFKNSVFLNFILLLPSRIFEIALIHYLLVRKLYSSAFASVEDRRSGD